MKKILKITGYVVGVLLVLLLLLLIVLQSPKAQTAAARKIVGMLDGVIDGDVSIGKVHIRPFDAVVLKDVAIVDRAPYAAEGEAPLDTFARARYITVRIRPATLLRQGVIDLTEAYVEDGYFVLTSEPDGQGNLKRIFRQGDKKPKEPKEPNDKEILRIGRVEINGFRFRLRNYKSTKEVPADAINWADLDVSDIHLKGRKLRMHGKVVEGIADELSFREKSGMTIHKMSGEARVGDGLTQIKNLVLRDMYSDLRLKELRMTYSGMPAFSNFIEEVKLDGTFQRGSRLNLETVGYFAPTLRRMSLVTNLEGEVHGYINDLHVNRLHFNTLDSGVSARVDGSLVGLPDSQNMLLNYKIQDMTFTLEELEKFIRGWAPKVKLGLDKYAKGETFTFNGTATGPINRLAVNGDFTSGSGAFSTALDLRNLVDPARPILIGGNLRTRDLDVGRIANIDALGPVTLNTTVQATLAGKSPTVRIDSLYIDRLHALGYDYTGIAATGSYSENAFDGRIIGSDPNLNFLFQGIFTLSPKTQNAVYKFYANLGYADLNALNIDKRGTSRLSLRTSANFNRVDGDDLIGNIDIMDVQLTDMNGHHDIGDISIASHINDDVNRIRLQSRFAEGTYVGTGFIDEFIRDLQDITVRRELPSLFRQEPGEWAGKTYDIHFQTHDTQAILDFLKPGIYVADSTDIRLRIDAEGSLNGTVRSRRIALDDKYVKDMVLTLDNEGALNGILTGSELNISPVTAKSNRLVLLAEKDHVGLGFSYDNDTEPANKGEILLSGELSRSPSDSLLIRAEVLPSALYLNGDSWSIKRSDIGLYGQDIRIGDLILDNGLQRLRIDGGYSPSHSDTLQVDLDNFDLNAVNPFIGGNLSLQGQATGDVWIASPLKDRLAILASLVVENASIAGDPLGTLEVGSDWNDERSGFDIRVQNLLEGKSNLHAEAFIPSSFKTAEGWLDLDRLDLTYAEPVLSTVFSRMDGYLSGRVDFSGPLNALELKSQDLRFEDAMFRVDYTDVPYYANGPVTLSSNGLVFDDVTLRDRFGARGRLRGSINWDHFKNMSLNLGIDITEMEALHLSESAGQAFYGNIFGTGRVSITGPLNAILLDVDADTAKEGDFHVPLDGASNANTSDLLTFKEPDRYIYIDPYDLMRNNAEAKRKQGNDMTVRIHVRPHPTVTAFIEVDKESGNTLSGHGNGNIDVEVKPSTSLFTINGNYTLTDGVYHFSALNIAKRDFTIQDGSSIKFGGDIMESDLDIQAIYRTKASIGTLIADTTSVNTRRNVECAIGITEKLRNPRISFSIEVPDLDPTTQARVQDALNSEDKVQKQFLSLLISGGFLPDETSGIVYNSSMLNSTVMEIMASQLSNILQKLDIPIDLGLDYQQSATGNDIFDVAVSTELFNNRVIVNGVIGNRQYRTGSANQEVVGDLDIEIKLDKTGAFRLKLFSHSADQYTNYLDNLQRNGVGLTYQQEYNSFGEFLKYLFTPKKRRTVEAVEPEKNRIHIEAEVPEDEQEEPETD